MRWENHGNWDKDIFQQTIFDDTGGSGKKLVSLGNCWCVEK